MGRGSVDQERLQPFALRHGGACVLQQRLDDGLRAFRAAALRQELCQLHHGFGVFGLKHQHAFEQQLGLRPLLLFHGLQGLRVGRSRFLGGGGHLLPLRGAHAPHEWQRQQRQGKPRLVQRCNTHALSAAGVWCL